MTSSVLLAAVLTPRWWLPAPASANAATLDRHLLLNLYVALALVTLLHLLLLAGLMLRRRAALPTLKALLFEYLPLTLLALIFIGLTVQSERLWAATRYTGPDPGAMQVEATGMQFAWYFRYPGPDGAFGRTEPQRIEPGEGNPLGLDPADPRSTDDIVLSELVLPAGREIDLRLHAQDVIHGFAVPELRLKQNAVPGQSFHIHFTADRPGTYAILCTQLCGTGHYRMAARLRVISPVDFQKWLAARAQPARPA